jgi:hypothetical protein
MAEKTIALPFSIDPYGKVSSTQDQSKIWADRVRSILGTTLRERVMRPTLGTVIPFAIFENSDNAAAEIKVEAERAFAEQLPLLRLQSVITTVDENTGVLNVEVIYALPNNETVSTVIGLVLVQGATPIYQELS